MEVVKQSAVERIESLATESNAEGLITDDFGNIRYAGESPKNYIKFNDEGWRIIGIFNVTTASGSTEKLMKIVKDTTIGDYSWDSSASDVNNGAGVNEWSQADLMTMLNAYYIGISTTCSYCNGKNQETCSNDCSSSVTLILDTYMAMIEEVVWNTGGYEWNDTGISVTTAYGNERGRGTGKICTQGTTTCNDTVERATTWQGKVGLIYPSDYGYASTDTSCRSNINDSINQPCNNNNWLHTGSSYWTLSPGADSTVAAYAWRIHPDGSIGRLGTYNGLGVRPTIYLKSDVSITSGNGSSSLPYQISMS